LSQFILKFQHFFMLGGHNS